MGDEKKQPQAFSRLHFDNDTTTPARDKKKHAGDSHALGLSRCRARHHGLEELGWRRRPIGGRGMSTAGCRGESPNLKSVREAARAALGVRPHAELRRGCAFDK